MNFSTYFILGLEHITDFNGYDHMLFIAALMASFYWSDVKSILLQVTAFTIGHSITLALVSLGYIPLNASLVEFLIPVTIFLTAIFQLISDRNNRRFEQTGFWIAGIFGLIHGMGFSNFFQSLLGKETSLLKPLFAFNIGVEVGQIIFVLALFVIQYVLLTFFKFKFVWWKKGLSFIAGFVSLYMITTHFI